MHVHLVMFEAWNISRFISVTNKRREIAGASELITYLDRRWVKDAVAELFDGFDPAWRIEDKPVELLETGAGNAKVLVRDAGLARLLVTRVTSRALRDAPGLEVCGVVSAPFDWSADGLLHEALGLAARQLAPVRTSLPGPDARFLRLPIVDQCRSTGLPAESLMRQPGPEPSYEPRSAESRAKWRAYGKRDDGDGLGRLADLAGTKPEQLGRVVEHLNDHAEWVGVVYADGNGLGKVFGAFDQCVDGGSNRRYADTLRDFSAAMQAAARDAFREAVGALEHAGAGVKGGDGPVPVLPLILGGDDMVALCDGEWALTFAEAYLREFERLTAAPEKIMEPLRRQGEVAALSACAGVAIVKPHFPFAASQDLAYALLREAKQVKKEIEGPCSALSFHVLYDSSGADLHRIRRQITLTELPQRPPAQQPDEAAAQTAAQAARDGRTVLCAQPYVVSASQQEAPWARGRHWRDLEQRVAALASRGDEGERKLPASQLHELREGLFLGPAVADARLENLLPDYGERGLRQLLGDPGSLFWQEQRRDPGRPGRWVTGLLDAMDAEGFLPVGAER
ncbi:Cas10/Cmr2 second palm domain-containing protein [Streptomyces spiralis]